MLEDVANFFLEWWDSFKNFFKSVLLTIIDILKEIGYWFFDSIIDLAIYILDSLGSLLNFSPSSYIDSLPPEVLNYMGLLGLDTAFSIIITCIGIRLIMQLIPFTRLGS